MNISNWLVTFISPLLVLVCIACKEVKIVLAGLVGIFFSLVSLFVCVLVAEYFKNAYCNSAARKDSDSDSDSVGYIVDHKSGMQSIVNAFLVDMACIVYLKRVQKPFILLIT